MSSGAVEVLTRRFVRDMSVCTKEEMMERWSCDDRKAFDSIDPVGFYKRTEHHNPIYYLAEKVFFDNKIGNPAFLYPPFHRDMICNEVLKYHLLKEGDADLLEGLLLLAQRDSFKSTFLQGVVPMWATFRAWELEGHRQIRQVMIHQKELQAAANLKRIKAKLRGHPFLRRWWSEFCSERDFDTGTEFTWPCYTRGQTSEHALIARGLTADLTGLHFDNAFFDDLVVKDHINSRILRADTALRYDQFHFQMDMEFGKMYHSGTLYHANDLWSSMIESGLYKVVQIGAGGSRAGAPLTFPTRHSDERLERMRAKIFKNAGNDWLWWLQMQNQIRSSTMVATDESWLQYIPIAEVPDYTWRVILIDPAWKGTENSGRGDYASIQVWALERRGNLVLKYLLDGVHSNDLTDAQGKAHIFRLCEKYGVTTCGPEERGGMAFRQSLKNEAASRGVSLDVLNLKSMTVNKTQRMTSFTGDCEARRVFICNECDPVLKRAVVDQFCTFGPHMDLDDALDCAAYTNDPEVLTRCVPVFNTRDRWRERLRGATLPAMRRTRHGPS